LTKAGDISGTYRIRDYTFIAGEHKTQTIHREFGCQFHVDIAKAYFSPRLSHEHQRVASLVQSCETVVDLFAGVGPFSVMIAKKNPNVKVYAVDLNLRLMFELTGSTTGYSRYSPTQEKSLKPNSKTRLTVSL
jgi:tRNA (guanine37-N1)-methyltransferase